MSDVADAPVDDTRTPSERVVEAVATHRGVDPVDVEPPLYDVFDPEALDSLFASTDSDVTVEFEYAGCRVRVTSGGGVDVSEVN